MSSVVISRRGVVVEAFRATVDATVRIDVEAGTRAGWAVRTAGSSAAALTVLFGATLTAEEAVALPFFDFVVLSVFIILVLCSLTGALPGAAF